MTCIKLQRLHFLDLITIFFLSCPGMKRRLSFETLNWLHDLSNDIMNNVTINPMCDCMTDSMSDPTDNTMTDQNCDIRAVLQSCNVLCVCSKPLQDEMKSHTGCIWLIDRIFSIFAIFWKNVTPKKTILQCSAWTLNGRQAPWGVISSMFLLKSEIETLIEYF